ncbi:MAG: ribulose-phosphate 3-epimerase [Saprospiraceae bacterium]|jgi:ribulose-phosphate 3-epimerase|nr:ribulose-phosphate 3-epimerase [Saprospiraceae bacterium]MDP4821484.1 ribulose-phosphate 3-epimerase [Saprospiraceae bacterium]
MKRKHLIAPSLLASDFSDLRAVSRLLNESEADWYHLDIMDGVFVPNISYGMDLVRVFRRLTDKPLDVHLMIVEPEKYIPVFRDAGADMITVHYEACRHLHRTLEQIRQTGAGAGVALNPHTPVSLLEDVLEDLDMVLVMSVNPGFGGQKFIYQSLSKIQRLRAMMDERNISAYIEVDGGVGMQNAERLLQAGADVLVAGSSIFQAPDPMAMIRDMKALGRDFTEFV